MISAIPAIAVLLALAAGQVHPAPIPPSPLARILVVPFDNTQRETRLTWLGEASAMLLATGDLVLKPDHHQEGNPPAAWRYFDIWMALRAGLQQQ